MGLKTDSLPNNNRSKQNPRDYKIKQIIETTRCTHSEAEEALQESNNELEAAVTWILDHTGDNIWTESKTRKLKKTEVVEERPIRGESGRRGRSRGGLQNSRQITARSEPQHTLDQTGENVWTESKTRKVRKPEGIEERANRGDNANRRGKSSNAWKAGQVFTRTEQPQQEKTTPPVENESTEAPAPTIVKPPPVIKTAAGPLSFAAACAAGGKKAQPPAPATSSAATVKPSSVTTTPIKPTQSSHMATPSTAKESSPSSFADTPMKSSASVSKQEMTTSEAPNERYAEENSVQSLTSQLKNDLGLGTSPGKNLAAPTSKLISNSSTSAANNNVPTRGTVEFVSDLNPTKTFDYHFGFNPESSTIEESSFKSSNGAMPIQNDFRTHENDVYKNSNVDSTPPTTKSIASAVSQLSNSYGVQPQQPQGLSSAQQQAPRRNAFGYAETSTVSFPPENRPAVNTTPAAPSTTTPASANYTKPAVTAQSSFSHPQQPQVQQPMHQQHTSQQQMYNPMYSSYPYVNLYSPVAGRAEDTPYAATPYHMPYAYNMDALAQMMPHMPMQAPVPGHHPQQQTTHRADHHQSFSDMKPSYGQGTTTNPNAATVNQSGQREASLSSSNVPPPPGFSGPPTNHMFTNQLQNMFHYPPMAFMHKMPNQMYGQTGVEDPMDVRHQAQPKMYGQQDKYSNGANVRDRMTMGNAQPTPPPPAQGGYGQQNSYGGNGQMLNSKKQQPYHGNQWNN